MKKLIKRNILLLGLISLMSFQAVYCQNTPSYEYDALNKLTAELGLDMTAGQERIRLLKDFYKDNKPLVVLTYE